MTWNNIDLLTRLGFEEAVEIAGPRAMQIIKCEIRDDWEKAGVLEEHLNDLKLRYQNEERKRHGKFGQVNCRRIVSRYGLQQSSRKDRCKAHINPGFYGLASLAL